MKKETFKGIEFIRVNNDINGNGRYVVHFLSLLGEHEGDSLTVHEKYDLAAGKSHAIGGRKYRGKNFGGGIVFQSVNNEDLAEEILKLRR